MRTDEFHDVRDVAVSAFGNDPSLGLLLDELRSSWAWEDELSFVAEADAEIVGQVLYTHVFVDAPTRLLEVLVLSPVELPGPPASVDRHELDRREFANAEHP